MISFNNTTSFDIPNKSKIKKWLCAILTEESFSLGELNFLFCDDHYLHQLNVEFLNHDTLTDILTFDYNVGQEVYGDVCISVDRVVENAKDFNTSTLNELHRVMAHG
ncbi:rRNA maturation RNase YbeY, partial [Flavobacteriaceae bacterium]|nr:rRNA maturation RNase YbeY [Flavobacteriaceae bacterium]